MGTTTVYVDAVAPEIIEVPEIIEEIKVIEVIEVPSNEIINEAIENRIVIVGMDIIGHWGTGITDSYGKISKIENNMATVVYEDKEYKSIENVNRFKFEIANAVGLYVKAPVKSVITPIIAIDEAIEYHSVAITPISIEDVVIQNIKIEGTFASLNKNDTIEQYIEEVQVDNFSETCLINEIITLSITDYENFTHNFLTSQSWLDNKGGHNSDYVTDKTEMYQFTETELKEWRKLSYCNCIMIKAEGKDSILINPEGYSYARYVGFMEQPTTPDPKPTKKIETIATDNKSNDKSNLVDLMNYKNNKVSVTGSADITSTEPATKRQLWALHIGTKLNTNSMIITKDVASQLISRSMKGENITEEVKAYINNYISIAK